MGLPVLCVATAIFALFWGMQNFSHNPVPSICIMLGTVGLSYYLLVSAHYRKNSNERCCRSTYFILWSCCAKRGYFRKGCLYEAYKQPFCIFFTKHLKVT